jgi:hypothetical protein
MRVGEARNVTSLMMVNIFKKKKEIEKGGNHEIFGKQFISSDISSVKPVDCKFVILLITYKTI